MFELFIVICTITAVVICNNKLTKNTYDDINAIAEQAEELADKAKILFDEADIKARMAGADSVIREVDGISRGIFAHKDRIREICFAAQKTVVIFPVYKAAKEVKELLSAMHNDYRDLKNTAKALNKDYNKIWTAKINEIAAAAAALSSEADTAVEQASMLFTASDIQESTYCEETRDIIAGIADYDSQIKQKLADLTYKIKTVKPQSSEPVSGFTPYTAHMKNNLQKINGLINELCDIVKAVQTERTKSNQIIEQARRPGEIIKEQTARALAAMVEPATEETPFFTRYDEQIFTLQRKALLTDIDAAEISDRIKATPGKTSNIAKNSLLKRLAEITKLARETADEIERLIKKADDERNKKLKEEQTLVSAAKTGSADAKYKLCEWYLNEKITGKFAHWLERAAEGGHIPAQRLTALFCYEGAPSFDRGTKTAMKWYERAAEQGDTESQFRLGALYYPDTAKPAVSPNEIKNAEKAAYWLEKAAAGNSAKAQGRLAAIYGILTADPDSEDKKSQWLEKAVSNCGTDTITETAMQIKPVDFIQSFMLLSEAYEKTREPLPAVYLGIIRCEAGGFINNPERGGELIKEGVTAYPGELPKDLYRALGNLYLNGRTSTNGEPDYYMAAEMLEKSGENRYILEAIREKAEFTKSRLLENTVIKEPVVSDAAAVTEPAREENDKTNDVIKAKELFDKACKTFNSIRPAHLDEETGLVRSADDIYVLNEALGYAKQALGYIPSDFPEFKGPVQDFIQTTVNLINIGAEKLGMKNQLESITKKKNALMRELPSCSREPEDYAPQYESAPVFADKPSGGEKNTKKPANIRGVHGDLAARIDGNMIRGIYGDMTARIDGNNIRGIHGDLVARIDGNVIRDIHGNITHRMDGGTVRDIHGNVVSRLD